MEHQHVLFRTLQLFRGQLVVALEVFIFLRARKPLTLDAGHIQHIQLRQHFLDAARLTERHVMTFQELHHVIRQGEHIGRDQIDLHVVISLEKMEQRMYCAAIFQITAQADFHVVCRAAIPQDGNHIGQRLCRVQMTAVSRVDHRHRRVEGRCLGCALTRIAHDDHVGVARNHIDRVLERLALRRRGRAGVGKTNHATAKAHHRGRKRQVGARGRLIKQAAEHLAAAGVGITLGTVNDVGRELV